MSILATNFNVHQPMAMTTPSLTSIEAYVVRFFAEHPQPALAYHTLTHTRDVVAATNQVARSYQLPEPDYGTVMTAAWFHDLGYLTGPPDGHKETGITLATAHLQQAGVSPDVIALVQGCIRATKMPQSPTNLLEEILCDADLFQLGADTYKDGQKLLRTERENVTGAKISGRDWRGQNIDLLRTHRYFTPYAQTLLRKGQADNLTRMLRKQAEKGESTPEQPVAQAADKKAKDKRPDRGIETLFRTTSTNHVQLSAIADSKANIMISVNAIMVSVVVSILPRRIEENPSLLIPTVLFLITSLLTIIFAILATRPNVTEGTVSREDIGQKKGNLLFFGNFHQMSMDDYEWGIGQLMQDSQYLYGTMTRDIYYLGRVLDKKYKLLRVAYTIFMVGFVGSILAFLLVFLFATN